MAKLIIFEMFAFPRCLFYASSFLNYNQTTVTAPTALHPNIFLPNGFLVRYLFYLIVSPATYSTSRCPHNAYQVFNGRIILFPDILLLVDSLLYFRTGNQADPEALHKQH